jgi:glycosyltransferase involved in cell wall biosynthesis
VKSVPSVDVITFTYNESLHIEYLVKWYSTRFRNLKITVYDNHSTDDTVAKARSLGCKVISWGHVSHKDERLFTKLKNECFKESVSDYFIICDIDELLDVTELDLIAKQPAAVQGIGYQMVGTNEIKFDEIRSGARDSQYDKHFMFRRSEVLEINYADGAHSCKPVFIEGPGERVILRRNLYHFRWLSFEFVLNRYKRNAQRVSEKDKAQGLSVHYFFDEQTLVTEYSQCKDSAVALPISWRSQIRDLNSAWLKLLIKLHLEDLLRKSKRFYLELRLK